MKVTNTCHNNMINEINKYIMKALSKADVDNEAPMMLTCGKRLKAAVHLHIHMKREKTTKERKREVSYMLSRDKIKMK